MKRVHPYLHVGRREMKLNKDQKLKVKDSTSTSK
jgi:hypothetical protein